MSQLAQRYAKAAWAAAATDEARLALVSDFAGFCAALTADGGATLRQVLVNPAFKKERGQVVTAVLQKGRAEVTATRLVHLLVEHERVALLPQVHDALRTLSDAAQNRLRAQIKVAVAPSDAQLTRLEEVLQRRMGKPVVLDVVVEPKLVTGMVCTVGKLTFDSSLRKQLMQFAGRAGVHGA